MEFDYNTTKTPIILREYGRNIHNLVYHIKNTEDKEERNRYANTLTELMKQLNPNVRDNNETSQKVWDDLYIMAEYDLDVDAPVEWPEKDIKSQKPQRVEYNYNNIRFKHYGKNVELLIKKAIALEDLEEKEAAIIHIGRLMRTFFAAWNRDFIEDNIIIRNIEDLSKGKLTIALEKVQEGNLFEPTKRERNDYDNNNNHRGGGHGHSHGRNNRNNRNNRGKNQKRRRN